MDFQQDFNFFKPQIALITLIFNKLQILQIIQINFNAHPSTSSGTAHEFSQIGWREASLTSSNAEHFPRRRESHNLLFNLLRIYSLPPWRNMVFTVSRLCRENKGNEKGLNPFMEFSPSFPLFKNFQRTPVRYWRTQDRRIPGNLVSPRSRDLDVS